MCNNCQGRNISADFRRAAGLMRAFEEDSATRDRGEEVSDAGGLTSLQVSLLYAFQSPGDAMHTMLAVLHLARGACPDLFSDETLDAIIRNALAAELEAGT